MDPIEWLKENMITIAVFFVGVALGVGLTLIWENFIWPMINKQQTPAVVTTTESTVTPTA